MPLLHRGELLQRERVDLAEHAQRPLGRAQPLLLLLADERDGLRERAVLVRGGRRDQLVGAVVGHQAVGVEAELLERALLELLDPHPLLGAGHLVAVHGVDQLVVLAGQVAQPGPDVEQVALASLPGLLDGAASLGGALHRHLEPLERVADRDPHGLGGPALAEQALAALGGAGPGLALGPGGAHQRVGAAVQRAGALLGGAQGQPGVHLALPGGRAPPRPAARGPRCRAPRRRRPRPARGGPRARPGRPGPSRGRPRRWRWPGRAARPRRGRPGPGSRTGRAPRRPPRGSRRTRAAWRARRRPAAGPPGARSRAGTCRRAAARTPRRPR